MLFELMAPQHRVALKSVSRSVKCTLSTFQMPLLRIEFTQELL